MLAGFAIYFHCAVTQVPVRKHMDEKHGSSEALIDDRPMVAAIEPEERAAAIDGKMSRDDQAHHLDRLHAWRDVVAWQGLRDPMIVDAPKSFGPPIDPEHLALAFYAIRRLEGEPGSLTKSRVLAATRPDADLVMELARTTDHALETAREQLEQLRQVHKVLKLQHDAMRNSVFALGEEIRDQVFKGEKISPLAIIERLDTIRSL